MTSADVVSPSDSSIQDGAPESAADANGDGKGPPSDAGSDGPSIPLPNGTNLAKAGSPELFGMTSDGYAVYHRANGGLYAVYTSAQDAGTPITISPPGPADAGNYFYVVVVGPAVFSWQNLETASGSSGATFVWSSATGAHQITGMTLGGFAAVSGDGSKILYAATTSSAATTGDITVANTDGSNPTVLESQVALGAPCVPQASFVGASQADPLVAYCLPTDAATTSATLDAFTAASWAKTNLATGLRPSNANLIAPFVNAAPQQGSVYVVDSSATNILTVSSTNEAIAIAYPAATSSNLESAAGTPAFLVGTGGAVNAVYTTQAGAVHASPFPAGTPSTLVPSAANFVFSEISPDGKWGVYGTTGGTSGGMMTSDLALFATSLPAMTKTVTASPSAILGGVGPSSFFTGDSTRLLWDDGITAASNGSGTYETFHAYDLANGSSATVADKVWIHYSVGSGTTVVFDDNSTVTSGATGIGVVADIKVVDVAASPLTPKLLQAGADVNFVMTPDQKTVIYAYTQGADAGLNGIYAVPLQ